MNPANTGADRSDVYRDGDDWAADNGAHPQVMRIIGPGGRCTAWLSSSNTITTAAHCLAAATPAAMTGWVVDPTMNNANPAQYAALQAMGKSTGGVINPGGVACVNQGSSCCVGADTVVLTFANPMPRNIMRPLRLIDAQTSEPKCNGSDRCITVVGTGRTDAEFCQSNDAGGTLDTSATQLFVESGLGNGYCPWKGDMLYGEYDFDDSSFCKGDSGSPILWHTGELMAQAYGWGGDGGDDVVGPVLWGEGPNTARDFYFATAADQDKDNIQAADDNCDQVANPSQGDFNSDGIGDACQDSDGDGINDEEELRIGSPIAVEQHPLYAITDNDELLWYHHDGRTDGTFRWASDGKGVGNGWNFKQVFYAGDGIIYAIKDNGDLMWYRHDGSTDGSFRWAFNEGKLVGTGWNFQHVFSGGDGIIYAITAPRFDRATQTLQPGGDLLWYRHDGRNDGTFRWAFSEGKKVGTGWNFKRVFSGGNGIIYAVNDSDELLWYRHDGRTDGTFRWAFNEGKPVGNGWNFRNVFSGGDGIIYAITAPGFDRTTQSLQPGGDLLWFRHDGRNDGSFRWAFSEGKKVGTGWNFKQVFSN